MHPSSMQFMADFVQRFLTKPCSVADIGSADLCGTYRSLFEGHQYTGLDVEPGPNVDRVVEDYDFGTILYDVVVSGQVLEHIEDLCRWRDAAMKILKPGGLICVIAPHTWGHHEFPRDCWRIFPDGMTWLFREYEICECKMGETDTVLVARNRKA